MKIQKRLAAILTAAFILSGSIPMPALKADQPPDEIIKEQDNTVTYNENTSDETQTSESETDIEEDSNKSSPSESEAKIDEDTEDEENTVKTSQSASTTDREEDPDESSPSESEGEIDKDSEDEENTVKASQSASMTDREEDLDESSSYESEEYSEDEENTVKASQSASTTDIEEDSDESSPSESEEDSEDEKDADKTSQSDSETEIAEETEVETEYPIPDEPPEFHARIIYRAGDYEIMGTFTDFTPDIISIDTLYSLDGVNWKTGISGDWNLATLGTDDKDELYALQNQPIFLDYYEPLKSYISGGIDRFYLKLHIAKENGQSYESQSEVIERGGLQSLPEEMTATAYFSRSIRVIERNPYRQYGQYQLTISANATAADVSALLPDTLPIEIQLFIGTKFFANCTIDCPVTWKPLSLPPLIAGESITILDAAEEILVPKGTVIKTPLGAYQLDQPLSLETEYSTDEVKLVLNIYYEDHNPTGVLSQERDGLYIAFNKKPTGVTFIYAHVLTEGESEWTELVDLALAKELNDHYSTENSGYALVLYNDEEPYKSYLAAIAAKETPTPFFIGLTIEGGVYDGQQLVLAWPDNYEQLPELPKISGFGGNEGNAGTNNNHDSTENGQRPNLPQTPDDEQKEQQPNLSQTPSEEPEQQQPNQSQTPSEEPEQQQPNQSQTPGEELEQQQPNLSQTPSEGPEQQQPNQSQTSGEGEKEQQTSLSQTTDEEKAKQQTNPNLSSDDNGLNQPVPTQTPEIVPAIPENQNTLTLEEGENDLFIQQLDSNPQKPEITESGQRPNLPQIAQNAVDTSDAEESTTDTGLKDSLIVELFDSPAQSPIKVQAAIEKKDMEIAIEHTTENDSHIPLLPMTIVVAAGICIVVVVCKTTGYDLFHRIAGKIRSVLHK